MKIVIIGGTGLIGAKLVTRLQQHGHETVPASPSTGVNSLTGEGLAQVLSGADVVVDVSNSPSFEEKAAMGFFETSTRNLLAAEAAAGVGHHVTLSVVGTERLSQSAYFRAKIVQEYLVAHSGIPYSILHATQFFEFIDTIVHDATVGDAASRAVRLAPVAFRPMAAEDVAKAVGRVAVGPPLNRMIETSGPEEFRLDDLIRKLLGDGENPREVITDPEARYFGALLTEYTLVPGDDVRQGEIRLDEWRAQVASLAGKPPRQSRATAEFA
jgi:uncharacterized protein YbjT (DUF2867 family)